MNAQATRRQRAAATARFLRLCLQARWRQEALEIAQVLAAGGDLDWQGLGDMVRRGGVAPLLYHTTRGKGLLPPSLERDLREDYFANARRGLPLFHALERALRALDAAGVPVILLKGAALAEAVHGSITVRPMGDVDLLLHERDVPIALRVLANAGYEVIPPRAYRCEVMVRKPGQTNVVMEIHWSLFVPLYYQYVMPMDWFWHSSLPVTVGGVACRMLGPEAQILHLCGHLLLHHHGADEPRMLWQYDVASVIARHEQQIDWDCLLGRARRYDLVLALQRILPRLSDSWDVPIPSTVLRDIASLAPSDAERRVVSRLADARSPALQRLWAGLADLPGWGPRLRFGWRNLFPPAPYLAQIYQVPHPLLTPLCYPYRWLLALRSVISRHR